VCFCVFHLVVVNLVVSTSTIDCMERLVFEMSGYVKLCSLTHCTITVVITIACVCVCVHVSEVSVSLSVYKNIAADPTNHMFSKLGCFRDRAEITVQARRMRTYQ